MKPQRSTRQLYDGPLQPLHPVLRPRAPTPPASLRAAGAARRVPGGLGGTATPWAPCAGRCWRRLRRSRIIGFLVQCMRMSSMHGLDHISTVSPRHPIERVVWALVVALAWYGAFAVSSKTWRRYQDTPTVTSLERDYMAWNTTFPSVTICPTGGSRVDPELLEEQVRLLVRDFQLEETFLREFIEQLAGATLFSLPDIPSTDAIPGDRFLRIIEKVSPAWNYSVVASLASDVTADATYNPRLIPMLTELGLCYAFNSVVAPYVSLRYWLGDESLDPRGLLEVNPMDGSVFAQLSGLPSAYQLFVHGPGEVPDLQSRFLTSPDGQFKRLEVSALATHTTQQARWLSPEQRRCRFTDEPVRDAPYLRTAVYSYNLCRRACRARVASLVCGCVPHLYGPMYDKRNARVSTCDVRGLQCITSNLASLSTLTNPATGRKVPCECQPNCNDVRFVVESDTNNPWFLGTDLKWSLSRYPRMRLKRNLLFGVTDLLVAFGSTAGLFLGCSVLSAIELLYFFTLRLFWFVRGQSSPPVPASASCSPRHRPQSVGQAGQPESCGVASRTSRGGGKARRSRSSSRGRRPAIGRPAPLGLPQSLGREGVGVVLRANRRPPQRNFATIY